MHDGDNDRCNMAIATTDPIQGATFNVPLYSRRRPRKRRFNEIRSLFLSTLSPYPISDTFIDIDTMATSAQISKKRKFIADGVFQAELGEFFTRELAEEGYSGCEVRVTHARTEIIIRATHTQEVLGDKGRRIRELKALVEKRFKFPEGSLELYAEKVQFRGLSAVAQAESLRYKLLGGLAMRR